MKTCFMKGGRVRPDETAVVCGGEAGLGVFLSVNGLASALPDEIFLDER